MFLKKLRIHNYKSLRNVCFTPEPFTALIGPNASGKSNFADAVHFLSEVYEHGLETAIARKGGYENIAFRKQRRTTAPIEFETTLQLSGQEGTAKVLEAFEGTIELKHTFSVQAKGRDIGADFIVTDENFIVSAFPLEVPINRQSEDQVRIFRTENDTIDYEVLKRGPVSKFLEFLWTHNKEVMKEFGSQTLFTENFVHLFFISDLTPVISRFRIYQFFPSPSREPSAPTPNPELEPSGKNLPALIDWLQKNHPKAWEQVTADMQDILQGLHKISLKYLHTKTLGLFFEEEGFGRSWNVDEVSDGTIQVLAILAASADPRTSLLLIEEPENSVHPWIVRMLVERLKKVSQTKNVIVTSQSPVLIDQLHPKEVWVVARQNGETQIRQLTDIDPSIEEQWEAGKYRLSDFLDSGLVPQVVPGGVF